MKLLMHVLKENKKLKIDNQTIGFDDISNKLQEEYEEVMVAILLYIKEPTLLKLKEIVRETFDLIQMCILVLWKCNKIAVTLDESSLIQDINIEHKDKLISRAWIIETGIEIDIKD